MRCAGKFSAVLFVLAIGASGLTSKIGYACPNGEHGKRGCSSCSGEGRKVSADGKKAKESCPHMSKKGTGKKGAAKEGACSHCGDSCAHGEGHGHEHGHEHGEGHE